MEFTSAAEKRWDLSIGGFRLITGRTLVFLPDQGVFLCFCTLTSSNDPQLVDNAKRNRLLAAYRKKPCRDRLLRFEPAGNCS